MQASYIIEIGTIALIESYHREGERKRKRGRKKQEDRKQEL